MSDFKRRDIAETFVRKLASARDKQSRTRLIRSLAALLMEQNMHSDIDLIVREIIDAQARLTGTLAAEVSYNFEPSQKVLTEIANQLKQLTGAREVIFDKSQQPDLLGGMRVRTPKSELDISLLSKLNNFKQRALKTT